MAKVKQPLMSFGASGSIANLLTFNQSNTAPTARRKPTGYGPPSLAQKFYRDTTSQAAAFWRQMPTTEKTQWRALANLSGQNVFAKYLTEWIAQDATPETPPGLVMR